MKRAKSSKDALSGIGPDRMFVLSDNTVEGVSSFRCLLSDTEVALPSFTAEELSCSPAYLAYSSGTTGLKQGKPKRILGVILTHRNIIANVLQIHETLVVARTGADEGIPIIVMTSFDFALLLKTIQTYKVSTVHIVPPITLALAYHPAVDMFDLSSSNNLVGNSINDNTRFAWILLSNIEARVIDTETGKELGVGEQGELCPRSKRHERIFPATMKPLLLRLIRMGIFIQRKNCFSIKIADAAVIGRPDELSGEIPVAYVVLKPGVTCTEDEIKSFIAKNVASHKLLRGGVVFIEKIPRAPTGKCLRRILQQQDLEYVAKAEE
ncbi:hypothetical protein BSLG_005790 [Batrachochytrium salamandrivorans]|nr:hypothetical protein BSLG_005790 [Batrachochytrium salamandrivorans]